MNDLDEIVRARLRELYPPADPRGIADAVRGRVLAGDLGSVPSFSGVRPWLPSIDGDPTVSTR